MFLSNRDIRQAIADRSLIVAPPPEHFGAGYDPISIDLHLGSIDHAKVWDAETLAKTQRMHGNHEGACLGIGSFGYQDFAEDYLVRVPDEPIEANERVKVYRCGNTVHVKTGGFLLWTTEETVGTPKENAQFVAFVNAKSTKARMGLLVHFSAPTIESAWSGKITLEIANFGPFVLVLRPGDAIAALTVARISSAPDPALRAKKSVTDNQNDPSGKS